MPPSIRSFSDLPPADRERLFAWFEAQAPGRHASAAAMAELCASTIYEGGATHLSAWRDGTPVGAMGVVVREIAPKGLAYLVGPVVAPDDREALRALLAAARAAFPPGTAPVERFGTRPDAPHMGALAEAEGFAPDYDLLALAWGGGAAPEAGGALRFEALAPATDEAYRTVSNAAFHDGPGGATLTPADVAAQRTERPHPALIGVGWAGEVPVAAYCLALDEGDGFIEALAVDPAYQGRGHGRALVAHAVGVLRAHGAAAVRLEVASTNAPALTLYRRMGFGGDRVTMRWLAREPGRAPA